MYAKSEELSHKLSVPGFPSLLRHLLERIHFQPTPVSGPSFVDSCGCDGESFYANKAGLFMEFGLSTVFLAYKCCITKLEVVRVCMVVAVKLVFN